MSKKYENWHTEEIIKEAIEINAELQARLHGTMFALSLGERQPNDLKEIVSYLLNTLRGKKEKLPNE